MNAWRDAAEVLGQEQPTAPLLVVQPDEKSYRDLVREAWDDGVEEGIRLERAKWERQQPEPPEKEPESFAECLVRERTRLKWRAADLARAAGCNPSTVNHLEEEKRRAARPLVDRLSEVMALDDGRRRRLLVLAGFTPVTQWSPALDAVADVLEQLEDPAEFVTMIGLVCKKWRGE